MTEIDELEAMTKRLAELRDTASTDEIAGASRAAIDRLVAVVYRLRTTPSPQHRPGSSVVVTPRPRRR